MPRTILFKIFNSKTPPLIVWGALMVAILLSSCATHRMQMPPVSQTPTMEHHVGKFVWFDLYTDDLETTSLFYEGVFGWSFRDIKKGNQNIKTIFRDNIPIATAMYTPPLKKNVKESRWLGYISVDDVDTACRSVKENKGSIYMAPKNIPGRGRVAVAIDPEGAIFALITATGGDPEEGGLTENFWMGSELWTNNRDDAVSFYHAVAGYETEHVGLKGGSDYIFLNTEGRARAGVVKIAWENVTPDWLPYIAVSDVLAVTDKARTLGGTILVKPDLSVLDGYLSIIADPSGAVFGIQQIPEINSGEEQ